MFLLVIIGSFLASTLVRVWMTNTYKKWSVVPNHANVIGASVAQTILDRHNLNNVRLEQVAGKLTDHYIPSQKILRLSQGIYGQPSVAAAAVAAHECGHAIQDATSYFPLKLKAMMMPMAAAGNQLGLLLAIGGSFTGIAVLGNLGLTLIALGLLMPVLTLPIEFDASKRALKELQTLKLVDEEEYDGAKTMLRAAAMTYVASAASSMAIMALFALKFIRR